MAGSSGPPAGDSRPAWVPVVDVEEVPHAYLLKAELPGIPLSAVEVTLDHRVLTIHGERRNPPGCDSIRFHRLERQYGAFERRFTLPADADADGIHATLRDGLLTVWLPKVQPERHLKR